MLTKLKKIYHYIVNIKKIVLLDSSPCDIVILENPSIELLACVPKKLKVNVLSTTNNLPLILSIYYYWYIYIYLYKSKLSSVTPILAIIRIWKPKVIITLIDNATTIGIIKIHFPGILGISVQNGCRFDYANQNIKHMELDQFYSFGEVEKCILSKGGHTVNKFYPIGSLRLGLFFEQYKEQDIKEFDICFLSQFTSSSRKFSQPYENKRVEAFRLTLKSLFNTVLEYCSNNNLKLSVAMRHPKNHKHYTEELEYYFSNKIENLNCIPNNNFSSYTAAQKSRLIITINSTLGYEMLGMGSRVIFASDIDNIKSLYLSGLWEKNFYVDKLPALMRLYTCKYEEFNSKVSSLINMSTEKYIEYSSEAKKIYMNLDKSNLPQNTIKKGILNVYT